VQDPLNSIENSIKVRRKQLDALLDDALMQSKRAEESALRQKVAADPALQALAGSAWDDMAKAQAEYRNQLLPYSFIENGAGFNSELYRYARAWCGPPPSVPSRTRNASASTPTRPLPQLEQFIRRIRRSMQRSTS